MFSGAFPRLPAYGLASRVSNRAVLWLPTQLSALALWLRADKGVSPRIDDGTTFVTAWADQSGHNRHFAQGTAANQPTLIAASDINGKPAIQFVGTPIQYLQNTTDTILQGTTDPFTIVFVAKAISAASLQALGQIKGAPGEFNILLGTNTLADNISLGKNTVWTNSRYTFTGFDITAVSKYLITKTSENALADYAVEWNGNAHATRVAGPSMSSDTRSTVGSRWFSSNPQQVWNGLIAEVIVMNALISAAEKNRLMAYLLTRYGV